uniref:Uncharacterized protein n=1 Tax=Octopus bimaculoides TaxID=37653 RepID=A0A0L8G8B6_OCTBM
MTAVSLQSLHHRSSSILSFGIEFRKILYAIYPGYLERKLNQINHVSLLHFLTISPTIFFSFHCNYQPSCPFPRFIDLPTITMLPNLCFQLWCLVLIAMRNEISILLFHFPTLAVLSNLSYDMSSAMSLLIFSPAV